MQNAVPIQETSIDDIAINVEQLNKKFRIPHERNLTVYQHLVSFIQGGKYSFEIFDALRDITFQVKRGETFGVIGPNFSGKSTLLKILAGVLYPDSGSFHIRGKIAPFLELGVGFQPDLTGKENIYLYGAIMGLTKKEIIQKYDTIIEFAELKRFESMKLKNFSSGMVLRLAFATAIQTNPDIILVDEVLSVGDEAFQRKCREKIDEIRREGKTIVLVSHDMSTVGMLCDRCMLLHQGGIFTLGDTNDVIEKYHQIMT